MCGIYIHCHYGKKFASYRTSSLESRGPDDHKIVETKDYRCEFYRLAIMPDAPQPVQIESVIVMFNGELYNFNDLRTKYGLVVTTECELIAQMYRLLGVYKTIATLDGEFAIVIVDTYTEFVYAFRDKFGVKPLYYSLDISGIFRVEISSDVKSLQYPNVNHLQPRKLHVFNSSTIAIHPIEEYYYEKCKLITHAEIFTALQVAVAKRITHTARPIGFLLSGGLDSSIILAIAIGSGLLNYAPNVYTYGFSEDAPDIIAAEKMVAHLKNQYGPDCLKHHIIIEDIECGINSITDTIVMLETYDVTTVRASVPMQRLCNWINENTNDKVIISGEGSDELFGGYLYNMYAPDEKEFYLEVEKRLDELYLFDNLRADRSSAAHGLEIRPPFLDFTLVERVLQSNLLRKPVKHTKELLITCLSKFAPDLLPPEILNRRKEAFSDAVSSEWKKQIERVANNNGETTKQYFKRIFIEQFGESKLSLLESYWEPNQRWINTDGESSAVALPLYAPIFSPPNQEEVFNRLLD